MLINERFKSPNKEFEKVFGLFRKKDYFDEKSQVKRKQEEFVRFLKKGDPMATKVFKQNKENMKSSLSSIQDMVMDYNKKNHFEAFKIFSTAVNDIEMKDSKSAERSGKFIKSKIHNNSQKYSLAIYSAIRKQKFNNYKDVHKDVDELISKNEGFSSDAQRKAAFANGYEEKGKKKNESVNEGKKRYYQKDGIGKAKYTISYHDGKKKHKDGSDFFDIQIFRNKKDLAKFVNTLHKGGYVYGFGESVNEGKYNYKADALTAYFKGKIDAKELDKIARDDFKSGIATKKELSNFLSNKFTQDVMSDTYGIPAGTLIKRVRGLMKFAEGVDIVDQAFLKAKPVKESEDGVPQGYNPMVESKTKESKVVQMIYKYEKNEKKFYDKMAEHERRIGPRDYGKFIINALRGFGINPREFKRVPDAEEKLYQTVSKK